MSLVSSLEVARPRQRSSIIWPLHLWLTNSAPQWTQASASQNLSGTGWFELALSIPTPIQPPPARCVALKLSGSCLQSPLTGPRKSCVADLAVVCVLGQRLYKPQPFELGNFAQPSTAFSKLCACMHCWWLACVLCVIPSYPVCVVSAVRVMCVRTEAAAVMLKASVAVTDANADDDEIVIGGYVSLSANRFLNCQTAAVPSFANGLGQCTPTLTSLISLPSAQTLPYCGSLPALR